MVRLEAEAIRDRMLAASGTLSQTACGPPAAIKEDETGQVIVDGEQTRRSLYIRAQRSRPLAMLQAFDAPVMETNCECRPVSTVATQSLMLMNGEFALHQALKLAENAAREPFPLSADLLANLPPPPVGSTYGYAGLDASSGKIGSFPPLPHWIGQVVRAWELALSRRPTDEEFRLAVEFLNRQLTYLHDHPNELPTGTPPERQAMINLCQALMSSNEFLYID